MSKVSQTRCWEGAEVGKDRLGDVDAAVVVTRRLLSADGSVSGRLVGHGR